MGLTQQQAAEKLGVSFQSVSKWECGVAMPGVDMLLPLAELLDVTVNELLRGRSSGQTGVVEKGTYILTASIADICSREKVIDGSRIEEGDVLLAVDSNGLHTNGYSLVRMMMDEMPQLAEVKVGNERFIEAIMRPPTVFGCIKSNGGISDGEMLRTFNCGAGLILAAAPEDAPHMLAHFAHFCGVREIGGICRGAGVHLTGAVKWE